MEDANIIMLVNSCRTKLYFPLHILMAALCILCKIPFKLKGKKKEKKTVKKGVCNVYFASVALTFKSIQANV